MTLFLPVLQHERELYQQQVRDVDWKNEMHAPDMQIWNEITQQLEVEKEGMQEVLEHGAYGVSTTLKQIGRGQHIGTQSAQILCAALSKSEMAKGILKKDLAVLQRRAPDTGIDRKALALPFSPLQRP